MANLTVELDLTLNWVDIKDALNLAVGIDYSVDLTGVTGGIVYQAITDSNVAPVGITGHPWRTTNYGIAVDSRRVTIKSTQFLWMRVSEGLATLVVTAV